MFFKFVTKLRSQSFEKRESMYALLSELHTLACTAGLPQQQSTIFKLAHPRQILKSFQPTPRLGYRKSGIDASDILDSKVFQPKYQWLGCFESNEYPRNLFTSLEIQSGMFRSSNAFECHWAIASWPWPHSTSHKATRKLGDWCGHQYASCFF